MEIQFVKLIEHAARRAGIVSSTISAEQLQSAKSNIGFLLRNIANESPNLWVLRPLIIGLVKGAHRYAVEDAVDIRKLLFRTNYVLTTDLTSSVEGDTSLCVDNDVTTVCAQVSTNGYIEASVSNISTLCGIGYLPSKAETEKLNFSYSQDGITFETIELDTANVDVEKNVWRYWDFESLIYGTVFRISDANGAPLTPAEVQFVSKISEVPCYRLNLDDYQSLPDKRATGSNSYQFYVERLVDGPVINLWPVPDSNLQSLYAIVQYYPSEPETFYELLSIPKRWYEYLVVSLALRLHKELPAIDPMRLGALEQDALLLHTAARDEERDNSPIRMTPRIRGYTR